MVIGKQFTFCASHHLPFMPLGHKCSNLHGHTFKFTVYIGGEPSEPEGMIVDFGIMKEWVQKEVIEKLDHSHLNDTIPNPTAENISLWIMEVLDDAPFNVVRVRVYESDTAFAEVENASR